MFTTWWKRGIDIKRFQLVFQIHVYVKLWQIHKHSGPIDTIRPQTAKFEI